jgi:hypothetical protein
MNLRGTPAQVACADIVLCVLVLRPHVETLFGGSGGSRSGGGMNGGSYLANASSRGMGGLGVGMRGGGAGRDSGGGGGPQFGAGIDAAEASALGMVSVDSPFSLPYPSTTRLTTQTPPISTQIPLKYHSNTTQILTNHPSSRTADRSELRRAPPPRRVDGELHRRRDELDPGRVSGDSSGK